ncbi:hypothetical protein HDU85_000823 [Gaertneriomyces sp. JEL0708]|nr:hypothetical protein HDU85_000823 [Gaertneriomyces sp. JEL0708]
MASSQVENLGLRPSANEPGEVIVTPMTSTTYETKTLVPAESSHIEGESTHNTSQAPTITDSVMSAAYTAKDALDRSGAVPRAKELATSLGSTISANAQKAASTLSQAASSATAPSAESQARQAGLPSTDVETVTVPAGTTVIVTEGTDVVTVPANSTATTSAAPNIVSGAQTAGSTAGNIAGTVAGSVSTAADLVKNAASTASTKLFGTGNTQSTVGQVQQSATNAGNYVESKAGQAERAIENKAHEAEYAIAGNTAGSGTVQNIKHAAYETTGDLQSTVAQTSNNALGSAQAATSKVQAAVAETANNLKSAAYETAGSVQNTAYEKTQTLRATAQDAAAHPKETTTSILATAGQLTGSVVGTVAGGISAATHLAAEAASALLHGGHAQPATGTTAKVVEGPWSPNASWTATTDVHHRTAQERGEQRAREIEATLVEKKDQTVHAAKDAVETVANSQPVVATTNATKQAYVSAQEKTVAAGTLVGDVAGTAIEKTIGATHVVADKTKVIGSSAYSTTAGATNAVTGTIKDVAAATYNTAAGATNAASGAVKNAAAVTYDTAASATNATTGAVKGAAAATYNAAAGATNATTEAVKNTAAATYDTAANATNASTGAVKSAAAATYGTAANATNAATGAVKGAAAATYDATASTTNAATGAAKNVASTAYDTAASTANAATSAMKSGTRSVGAETPAADYKYSPVATTPITEPSGITGPVGSSGTSLPSRQQQAPRDFGFTSGGSDFLNDTAMAAVTIPSDRRTAEQQAAIDAALSRDLTPMGLESGMGTWATSNPVPTDDELGLDITMAAEYALADATPLVDASAAGTSGSGYSAIDQLREYSSNHPSSVLPGDMNRAELAAPPTDATSTRSIPAVDSKELPVVPSETYDDQRASLGASTTSHQGETADVLSSEYKRSLGLEERTTGSGPTGKPHHHKGFVSKIVDKLHPHGHKAAATEE